MDVNNNIQNTDWEIKYNEIGKKYFYNKKKKKISWIEPKELKGQKKQEEQQNLQMENNIPQQTLQTQLENQEITENEKRLYYSLLSDYDINQESKWDKLLPILQEDQRFKEIASLKEKKKLFKEFVEKQKRNFKKENHLKKQKAKENFKKMLEDYKFINTGMKFKNLASIFYQDPRWKEIDDKEKEDAFQEYLEDIFVKEIQQEKQTIKNQCEQVKNYILSLRNISTSTTWNEICQEMKDESHWNSLHPYYRLKTFREFIEELRDEEIKKLQDIKEQKRRQHRIKFRSQIEKMINKDQITPKTQWIKILKKLQDSDSYYDILGQQNFDPKDIFYDYIIELQQRLKTYRKKLKIFLQQNTEQFPLSINYDQFKNVMEKNSFLQDLENQKYFNSKDHVMKYLFQKMKKRQSNAQKKFCKYIASQQYDVETKGLDQTLRDIEQDKDNKYIQCLSYYDKEKIYQEFLLTLRNPYKSFQIEKNRLNGQFENYRQNQQHQNEEREPGEIILTKHLPQKEFRFTMQFKKPPARAETIHSRYAEVLYTYASKNEKISNVQEDLQGLKQYIDQSLTFRNFLQNPSFHKSQQLEILGPITKNYSEVTRNFIDAVIENRKLNQLEKVIQRFDEFVKLQNKEESIKVISAKELSDKQKDKLGKALKQKLGHSNFTVEYDTNSNLLGGLQVYFGNTFLDCSLQSRVNLLQNELNGLN